MDRSPRLEGNDWQRWATKLLHRRYPPGEYQEVPDGQSGDAGIEGYSLDGCAYQMYGPEGELTFAQRHAKFRDKMAADIKKFIENKDKLSRLLGSLKIRRWILLVPAFDSRELVEHATKKTDEVLKANLPYVDADDFRVVVVNEDAFALERQHLLNQAVAPIVVQTAAVTEQDIEAWTDAESNSEHLTNLDDKIQRLPTVDTAYKRKQFRSAMVKYLLHGQNVLDALRNYPDIWADIRRIKSERELYLWTKCISSGEAAGSILQDALNQIRQEVKTRFPALSSGDVEAIAHEAVADWLMRCPLDFPEVRRHG